MEFFSLLALGLVGWFIWITVSTATSRSRIDGLAREVAALKRELQQTRAAAPDAEKTTNAGIPAEVAAREEPTAEEPHAHPGWSVAPPAATPQPAASAPAKPIAAREGLEKAFGTRWTVWLGGVAIALGAIFLVQYSIQSGYFGPGVRVALSTLLSAILLATGEFMRRRPHIAPLPQDRAAQVPPILTAAGLVAAYATTYAAYALYDMIGPMAAFILLGLLSIAAMLLAGLHASYVGAIGLMGSVLTPALVQSESPKPEILFLYLTFVLGTSMATSNIRGWRWLDAATLVASIIWPVLWIAGPWQPGDELVVGFHLLALYGLRLFLNLGESSEETGTQAPRRISTGALIRASAILTGLFVVALLDAGHDGPAALAILAIYASGSVAAAWAREKFLPAVATSAPIAIIGISLWSIPLGDWMGEPDFWFTHFLAQPLPADAVSTFLWASALAGALYAIAGYARLASGRPHRTWSLASALTPLALFVVAYARVTNFTPEAPWAGFAIGLAILCGMLTKQMSLRLSEPGYETATASYATATVGFLAAAFAIILRNEWLTVALALLVPGLAWVQSYLPLRMLGRLAVILTGVVIVRLIFNPALLQHDIGETIIFNALLYGYGAPAAFLAWGAWLYRRLARDEIADPLEAAAILLAVVLSNLEINHAFAHGHAFTLAKYDLAQNGAHLIVWLLASALLFRRNMSTPRAHYRAGATILRFLSYIFLIIGLTFFSPLIDDEPITEPLLLDRMLLAYFLPALIAACYSALANRDSRHRLALIMASASFIAGFAYYSLEVRRFFHTGSIALSVAPGSEAESYAFSAAWLILGGALLAAAFVTRSQMVRFTSLAVVMLVVAKVFILDMAGLTGILRAASFLGLGGALIGIGLFYQKVVFRNPAEG
ncbi:DUF2339 domain-containing protein [Parvibaculum sedimenti]|uniref:DUF2339 domain-containing protein n=1 Tax=Parvibaculum sedimenti TaxID=2608632 RepID=A0A6N6VGT3_9HYPH|nr:DUF2339 domain-containing protein [Parvibaculum sedimenti]KAB7739918.1 DUF2339 domain-containing protein [Parvibaculum sedimenti]